MAFLYPESGFFVRMDHLGTGVRALFLFACHLCSEHVFTIDTVCRVNANTTNAKCSLDVGWRRKLKLG